MTRSEVMKDFMKKTVVVAYAFAVFCFQPHIR